MPGAPEMFVSQREFKQTVAYADEMGLSLTSIFPPHVRVIVHPDALRWYQDRLALARLRMHFGLLDH